MDLKAELVEGKVDWKGRTALKYKHGGMRASLFILAAFGFENLATIALAVNLVTYFMAVLHFNVADSANNLTNFMGTSYILSIFMAVFADTFIGRFKTALVSGCLESLGLALLAIQAHIPKLRPLPCNFFDLKTNSSCEELSGGNKALLFIGLYLLAVGSGGLKATLPAIGADQFDEKNPREARQMSSFFNSLLLALCVGGAVSLTMLVWIQDNKGWDWGFGISTIALLFGLIVFLAGLPTYRLQTITGSTNAIVEIVQVYVAAICNRNLKLPEDSEDLYEIPKDKEAALIETEFVSHTNTFRFLDKAAIQLQPSSATKTTPWRLCRVTQVENAKTLLGMLPIFGCTIVMTLCLAQLQTFSIQQGQTMDKSITSSFHIPPASLPILPVCFLIVIIPFYDRVVVPLLRKLTGVPTGITHLQRIGVGLVLSAVSMAVAAVLEVKRKRVARVNDLLDANPQTQSIPISIFWLSFQYFIFGIADMFTYVGLLEFFYSEAPKSLKSFSTCFLWSSMALGYFCSTVLVKTVNRATKGDTKSGGWLAGNNINRNHLNLFYWLLSAVSIVNFSVYLFASIRYKYRPKTPVVVNVNADSVDDKSKA